ncbi:MAG: hypothetical protein HKO56_02220, partial [Bacteroidia bacterium]|nr:hypothetical protein [Bacteroidia bacterium]
NNVAPPDSTISNLAIEGYINKVYISVLGREPDSSEYAGAWNVLNPANASPSSRTIFLDNVFIKPEYNNRIYDLARADYLNNVDTLDIIGQIALYQSLLLDSSYYLLWDIIEYEKERAEKLQEIPADLLSGLIDIKEVQKRCSDNYVFDDLNMGSLNFVVAVFQNIIRRYPTMSELNASIEMVDGTTSILFFEVGSSKDDFLDIFFDSSDYYEGQVRDLYLRYLLREPNTVEMSAASIKYKNSDDYKQLHKDILILDEYMGI